MLIHVTPHRYSFGLDMGSFQAVYYRARDGSEPVNDFIDQLDAKRQVAIDNQIDRLNMLDPSFSQLPFPHSSQIEGEPLWTGTLSNPLQAIAEPHCPAPHLPQEQGRRAQS
jgi:hypothetical protein